MRQIIAKAELIKRIGHNVSVLDIGGFDGSASLFLESLSARITVLDVDREGLDIARSKGLAAVCASAAKLPFREASFDVALSFDLLTSIPVEAEERIFFEIGRVLRDGGYLFLTELDSQFSLPFVDQNLVHKRWKTRSGLSYGRLQYLVTLGHMKVIEHRRFYSRMTRLAYTVLFYWNLPRRGGWLKRLIFSYVVSFERWWCPAPGANLVVARAISSSVSGHGQS